MNVFNMREESLFIRISPRLKKFICPVFEPIRPFPAIPYKATRIGPRNRIFLRNNPFHVMRNKTRRRGFAFFETTKITPGMLPVIKKERVPGILTLNQTENVLQRNLPPPDLERVLELDAMTVEDGRRLIGDFSRDCSLPVIRGTHGDLATVLPQTVAGLIENGCRNDFVILDCRYPYEYEYGHVENAANIYLKQHLHEQLFSEEALFTRAGKIVIFYCEFSSMRAPGMYRLTRKIDRSINEAAYPFLCYPEMYVMEGGYKFFFLNYQRLCTPGCYRTMHDPLFKEEECRYWKMTRSLRYEGRRLRSIVPASLRKKSSKKRQKHKE